MTPKEKANELVSKFVSISLSQYVDLVDGIRIRLAKYCALIAVDEILDLIDEHNLTTWDADIFKFWFEVKLEIKQL